MNPAGSNLVYSTYLGGNRDDEGNGIAVDALGNAYVTGFTHSTDFPTTPGAFQTTFGGGFPADAFVTKLNPDGSDLDYSTYLGGSNDDRGFGIALDALGNAYVTGSTNSNNFPTTPGAFQTMRRGNNAFVTKLNPDGSDLVYSTYLGGSGANESGNGIAVDALGNAYVTGRTDANNFPTTPGAFQTTFGGGAGDAFITKLNPDGSDLDYSTYLGGSSFDTGNGIAVDGAGNAYVAGWTSSNNFPTTPGAFQTTFGGGLNPDAFVTKLNPDGSDLDYSTYLGSVSDNRAFGIAVDTGGNAYVTGFTSGNFPTTPDAFQTIIRNSPAAFISKLNLDGSDLVYSTYFGGLGRGQGSAIAVDALGNAYVTGIARSINFPTTAGAFQTTFGGGTGDAFIAKFSGF